MLGCVPQHRHNVCMCYDEDYSAIVFKHPTAAPGPARLRQIVFLHHWVDNRDPLFFVPVLDVVGRALLGDVGKGWTNSVQPFGINFEHTESNTRQTDAECRLSRILQGSCEMQNC